MYSSRDMLAEMFIIRVVYEEMFDNETNSKIGLPVLSGHVLYAKI